MGIPYTKFSLDCEKAKNSYKDQISATINDLTNKQNQVTEEDINTIVSKNYDEFKSKIDTIFNKDYKSDAQLVRLKEMCIKAAGTTFEQLRKIHIEALSKKSFP